MCASEVGKVAKGTTVDERIDDERRAGRGRSPRGKPRVACGSRGTSVAEGRRAERCRERLERDPLPYCGT